MTKFIYDGVEYYHNDMKDVFYKKNIWENIKKKMEIKLDFYLLMN